MTHELRARILAYNKALAVRKEKAEDLDIIVREILLLPFGQVKKLMTDEVMAVLAKYGYEEASL